ncbi:MAG: RagB/SusD family nutrient uptake outer membrane protein [Bacteroidetes bacterium]|nr:RagB/SusD family nutrient uptake outer membrane protein [Bacteroidota bacterium]
MKHTINFHNNKAFGIAALLMALVFGAGCKKFVTIPLPVNSISGTDAFASDGTTSGVLNAIYYDLQQDTHLDGALGLGYNASLYTDELQAVASASATAKTFYGNVITGDNGGGIQWNTLYPDIQIANTTIEAMRSSSLPFKNQWLGEALFLRGLMFYYLVSCYGDVALPLTSDYVANGALSRTPKADVYKQIITDLKEAQGLLGTDYVDYNGKVVTDRSRPNKAAATALLARIYLYTGDWANAEAQASTVIGNNVYALETPANVFLVKSKETVWSLLPTQGINFAVRDAVGYLITTGSTPTSSGVSVVLSPQLLASFEPNDARYTNWVGVSTNGTPATNYYYANKYKVKTAAASTEALSMLRLSEQYLIRAEARAQQNNLGGAISDINMVRTRATLPGTTAASQADLINAVMQERKIEFFTELGHRFFDLKRIGKLDGVMGVVSPQKGSNWSTYMQYWPIPNAETLRNPNLKQTPGYQQ